MKQRTIIIIASVLAIGSLGYFLYQKKRVKDLNERVDKLEDALSKIRNV